jgi:hypothetical protein
MTEYTKDNKLNIESELVYSVDELKELCSEPELKFTNKQLLLLKLLDQLLTEPDSEEEVKRLLDE